jgi:hypothetical protein
MGGDLATANSAARRSRVSIPQPANRKKMKMTNDLTINEPNSVSPYRAFADEADTMIRGDHVKFAKGEWTIAGNIAPKDAKFIANLDEAVRGWVRWFDKRPVERLLVRVVDRTAHLPREDELSHRDEKLWETDANGEPKDPWQLTYALAMRRGASGEDATFLTSSWGGQRAIRLLFGAYDNERDKHQGLWPVVELGCEFVPNKTYGKIAEPRFPIVGWRGWGGGATKALPPGGVTPDDPRTMMQELDDVIPF